MLSDTRKGTQVPCTTMKIKLDLEFLQETETVWLTKYLSKNKKTGLVFQPMQRIINN